MPSIQAIARETRRGLFGTGAPARAWNAAIADFQRAREELTRAALELQDNPPDPDDSARVAAWDQAVEAVNRQITLMDGAASGLLTASNIANGLGDCFPGFHGASVAGAFGLGFVAAPAAIALLRAMSVNAWNTVDRVRGVAGPSTGLGQYAPWGRVGGDVWEWIHAGQVQQEYEAVGKVAPTIDEIREGAATDIGERVTEGVQNIFSGIKTVAIAGAVIAVAFLWSRK